MASILEENSIFKVVAQSAIDAVTICDAKANIVYFNDSALKMFGYTAEELIGKSDAVLVPEEFRARHRAGLQRLLSTGQAHFAGQIIRLKGQKKDGTIFPIEMSVSLWKTGGQMFFTAIIRDITDRVELENLRDKLVYMIVHDLKNPLTGIFSTIEMLKEGLLGPVADEQKTTLENAHVAAKGLLNMIMNILDVNKLEEKKLEPRITQFPVADLLRDINWIVVYARSLKKEFITAVDDNPTISADRGLLQRILENLISNSIKHTALEQGRIELRIKQAGGRPLFEVIDNGEGIPKEYQDEIFEKYAKVASQKRRTPQDTGLGLAFCKLAVEAMGGGIGVESETGKGARFYFYLGGKP